MMAVVQSAAVAHYCSTTGCGAGELSLLVPIETVADLAAFREIGRRRGDPSLPVGVELADVLAERDRLRDLVKRMAAKLKVHRGIFVGAGVWDETKQGETCDLIKEARAALRRR